MRQKIKRIADDLVKIISSWDSVEAISCTDSLEMDRYDPYFSITLDVYYNGRYFYPGVERKAYFEKALYFESSTVSNKDRFMMNDFPVRIEYKNVEHINKIFDRLEDGETLFREKGTYMFHRLAEGGILFEKGMWLTGIRSKLESLPDRFWAVFREAYQMQMEHYLSDLGASVFRDDSFFYKISLAGFLKYVCCTLFAINKRFEPSTKLYGELVEKLSILPSGFMASFEVLNRIVDKLSSEKCREVAELLAKAIIAL